MVAEQETRNAYKEMDALKRKHEDMMNTRNQFLVEPPQLPNDALPPSYHEENASIAKYDTEGVETANDEQWRDEFKAFYDKRGEDDLLRLDTPTSWFSGYDRCNI